LILPKIRRHALGAASEQHVTKKTSLYSRMVDRSQDVESEDRLGSGEKTSCDSSTCKAEPEVIKKKD
jgi:hypothetical protein